MADQEDQREEQQEAEKSSAVQSKAKEALEQEIEQLKVYLIVAIGSFCAFLVFALTLVGARLLSDIWPGIGMILRIVAWPVTVCGAICCIAAVLMSSVGFLRYLIRKFMGK